VSLFTRSLSDHGLWPYLQALPDITSSHLSWSSILLNLLVGFGAIGKTAFDMPPIPQGDFLVAINPLPGDLAGWYEIARSHRLNVYAPFAALGELGNSGWPFVVGYCLAIGFVLGYLDRRMRTLLARGQQLYGVALVGIAGLSVVLSTQYNLRSTTRLLYYALVLDLIVRVWLSLAGRSRNQDSEPKSIPPLAANPLSTEPVHLRLIVPAEQGHSAPRGTQAG
jgi:hypothetical protein